MNNVPPAYTELFDAAQALTEATDLFRYYLDTSFFQDLQKAVWAIEQNQENVYSEPSVDVLQQQIVEVEKQKDRLIRHIAFSESCLACPVKCPSSGKMVSVNAYCIPKIEAWAKQGV